MNKRWLILALILLFSCSLTASGCKPRVGGGETVSETAAVSSYVRSGSTGLRLQFATNYPPKQLYDTGDLAVLLDLRNEGAYDLSANKCFVQLSGYDPSILRGIVDRQSCGEILGKSVYFTDGGFEQLEFTTSRLILPNDVDRFKPDIVATACYEYQTIASPQICVDPQFYDLTSEQKACQVRDFGLSGGQGAPVGVSFVNVDMISSKALVELDIQNVGGGRVISPRASLTRCPSGLRHTDFDEVRFKVELSNAKLLSCTPDDGLVRLNNGRAKVFCTFDVGNTQAYQAPLRVELDYHYMDSIKQTVEIIRTPR